MKKNNITVFTDGSSRGNPGPGGFGAIICFDDEVKELGGREENTTNNRMELSAAINVLAYIGENSINGDITLQTDSKYVIQGITKWIKGWRENGWKTAAKKDVGNRDLWEALEFVSRGLSIEWKYIEGHAGHAGNERCDVIATSFADNEPPSLFHGKLSDYRVDLFSKSSGKKINLYLSYVDGVLMEHNTWAECENRVKGVKGAKFKKVLSESEKNKIVSEWMTENKQA